VFSVYPSESVTALYKEILFYVGFFAMSFYLKVFDDNKFYTIIFVYAVSAVIVALIGIFQFNLKFVARAESLSSGYSTFSSYLLTSLGIFLILYEFIKRKYNYYFWSAGIAFIVIGLVTSLGRANLFFAAIIIIVFLSIKKIKIKYIATAVILIAGLSYLSFINNSSEVVNRIETPGQLSDRDIILEGAKQIYKEHPVLGYGPRTFHQVFPFPERFADRGIGSWHNDFIQIYFESGIIGEISFLILLVVPFINGIKLLRRIKEIKKKSVVLGVLLAISGLVLSALFAGFIDSPVLALVFAFLISVISRESLEFS
jgi:O-antigen ligase